MGYKTKRILYIYKRLLSNHHVNVKHMAQFFNTNIRTIQRDIQDIKSFLNEQKQTVLYEKTTCNYYIAHQSVLDDDHIQTHATFEMTYQVYRQINKQYETYIVQKNRQTLKVMLAIPKTDAINICFMYRKSLRLISPETLVKEFSQELSQLQTNYILNTI
ncbi:HTH domain-containing protein [Staphylococcus epidermidis]|nr:HTH domain-containing protein [Staphylococcus epidermidis]MCG1653284.1 HTH domain-containing protein [Staphylococcus epidermidis]MCG1867133.1 HTH domain-containing protein [Staphylococcus epidermidis]MCG1896568.1 HTH domain-containing protein [Staphylococcus epidermidis]